MKKFYQLVLVSIVFLSWTATQASDLQAVLEPSYDKNQGEYGSPLVKVHIESRQFRQLSRDGRVVEVRLYAGEQKGQERRIERRNGDAYIMENSPTGSYTFPPSVACPKPGNYFGKIWLDVKQPKSRNASKSSDLSDVPSWNSSELRFDYTCYNKNAEDLERSIHTADFRLDTPVGRGQYRDLRFRLEMDSRTFAQLNNDKGGIEVRWYANRDGQRIRIRPGKQYKQASAKHEFTLPLSEVCGELNSWWDSKEVSLSYEVLALHPSGSEHWGYYRAYTPRGENFEILCQ